ncbi:MAG: hypothetical protein KatS3mg128_0995 [Silanimonas sp.]|nr:MAG: hypothetical protein KatS3mg128_0995 [Silanimonas sp.]
MVAARFEQGSALALWQGLVAEGEDCAGVRLSETTESYLVFLLMQHLRDGALAGRTLALEWLSALERVGTLRAEQLREVGDRSLLIAGLYPGLAERRRVGREYYVRIGELAYDGAADSARRSERPLFAELAATVRPLVRVLAALRKR